MVSFAVVFSAIVIVANSVYVPPYYGGSFDSHESDMANHGGKYGGYGALRGGQREGYEAANYGGANGEEGYYEGDYGSHGAADAHSQYANGGADGYDSAHHKEDGRHANDAEGKKKFEYFSSGSGPEGSYSKGYYGSEGYEHSDNKAKYAADAKGEGFKKGYDFAENDKANAHSAYDKASEAEKSFGKKHEDAVHGFKKSGFEKAGHADGWVNAGHAHGHAAHGPSY